MVYYERDLG